MAMDDMGDFESESEPTAPVPEKKLSFKEAFASARAAGDKTFEWNGKKFTTDLAKPKAKDMGDETARLAARTTPSTASMPPRRSMVPTSRVPGMGAVQVGYKKGGAVSASRRGDGIAQRGKTRGQMK